MEKEQQPFLLCVFEANVADVDLTVKVLLEIDPVMYLPKDQTTPDTSGQTWART